MSVCMVVHGSAVVSEVQCVSVCVLSWVCGGAG